MDADKLKWVAIIFALVAGACMVVFGAITGDTWVGMVGSLLGGGGAGAGLASTKRVP